VSRDLYDLLPAIYRERDEELGGPLKGLLRIVQEQSELVEQDVRQLWDDFFIDTCEPWVIPYLGDLVANLPLFDASRVHQPATAEELFPDLTGPSLAPEVALRSRADVAKTIHYRRRKGTLPMLEELARDVTGWGAHAVEFFALLGWTQCVRNHLRMHSLRTPDLRRIEPLDRLNGPFDAVAHTVDVRPIAALTGWYNVKNVGFFLWRLRSHEVERVAARQVESSYGYAFSPLGNPAPLFTRWRREGDEAGLATELHVPGPIRPAAFYEDLQRYQALPAPGPGFSDFYGLFDVLPGSDLPPAPNSSLVIVRDGAAVPPEKVRCRQLTTWLQPTDETVGVDVKTGRIAFGTGFEPIHSVDVWFHQGFSADLGGGSYPRRAWLVRPSTDHKVYKVAQGPVGGAHSTLQAALNQWTADGKPNAVISILDSRTYEEAVTIEPRDDRWVAIEAADEVRPHLKLTSALEITGSHPKASVTLSGLLVEGLVHVSGELGRLRLLHTTLVPGRSLEPVEGKPGTQDPSLLIEGGTEADPLNEELKVEIAFSVTGPLRLPEHALGLWVLDSIVDGVGTPALAGPEASGEDDDPPAPPAWLERVTLFGSSRVAELRMASEVIFTGPVVSQRRQDGCVRFSFLAAGSKTPRRYRCQPDLEIAIRSEEATRKKGAKLDPTESQALRDEVEGWLVPTFTSDLYGQPEYAQLHLACPRQISAGAEDGSEMGAFCHLKQPQREANLRLRLEEYLPFGLAPGILYVT
jgi:hypothetical protein